ncbi:MAG TPA: nuclear transport factor 2 family protein [Kofleriaceae bacterium]|nr:nuclear transport factor 2 family protein [Kofleriaceae bacterium]
MSDRPPSRALLILAGLLTQLIGVACLVLALASVPVAHDLHRGMQSVIASAVASLAAIVCGTLVYRGRLVPLALAAGVDIGFGIVVPRGGSAIGVLLRILPASDASTAEGAITGAAIAMFVAAVLCVLAFPSALALRRWARDEIAAGRANERPSKPTDTLKGVGPARLVPTQVLRPLSDRRRSRPLVIVGVATTLIALGIILISAATSESGGGTGSGTGSGSGRGSGSGSGSGSGRGSGSGSGSAKIVDAGVAGDAAPADAGLPGIPAPDTLVTALHAALVHASPAELAPLLDSKAFAFGVEAHEVAEGQAAVIAQLRHDLGDVPSAGFKVEVRFSQLGHDGDLAWLAEELRVGAKVFVVTAVASVHGGTWTIAALHWAEAMPNDTAYKLARDGDLATPDAIPDRHDDSALAQAMRAAFASKPSFVEARSTRPDGFNFGSAPGERILGGDAIRKTFGRIRATLRLHDAVKVGTLGDRGGWGAANVDFTDADRDGTQVTQTFRVLVAWIREGDSWRIVQTQFSNPR